MGEWEERLGVWRVARALVVLSTGALCACGGGSVSGAPVADGSVLDGSGSDGSGLDDSGLDGAGPIDAPAADANPIIVGLSVLPAVASVASGNVTQFAAFYDHADGSRTPASVGVTWTATPASIASVDANGGARGKDAGDASIRASSSGLSGSATLHVTAAVLVGGFAIAPLDATIDQGTTLTYTASADFSDGVRRQVTSVTWSSSMTSVATIDDVIGVAAGQSPGTTMITGAATGTSFSATTSLTVATTPPPPGAIGAACTSNAQCNTAAGLSCQVDPVLWPGGYCTKDCTADHRVCPIGSSCYPVGAQGSTFFCIQNCAPSPNPAMTVRSSCRVGYCCFGDAATSAGGCFAAMGTTCP